MLKDELEDDNDKQKSDDDDELIEKKAIALLQSPDLFHRFVQDIRRDGLVGEKRNAVASYVVGTSRLREHPVNAMVKGRSSAGKNYLVRKVLAFFPEGSVHEISTLSAHALNFISGDQMEHRILYFYEVEGTRSAHPNRLLISEGKLVHWYTNTSSWGRQTVQKVAAGPVACFSTTTARALKIDDESRHLSLWTDESPTQTKRIASAYLNSARERLTGRERQIWIAAQNLLEERKDIPITLPEWSEKLVDMIPVGDIRIRRYWPAFIEAWKTVALIRSYRYEKSDLENLGVLMATFKDFAVANLILDRVLWDSLTRSAADEEVWVAEVVDRISTEKRGPVAATDLLDEPGVTSADKAYRLLRNAERAGTIFRANRTEKDNVKLYLRSGEGGFLGEPDMVMRKLGLKSQGKFVHPITGKIVIFGQQSK